MKFYKHRRARAILMRTLNLVHQLMTGPSVELGGPRGCGCVTSWREVLRVFNVAFAFFSFSFIELSRTMES